MKLRQCILIFSTAVAAGAATDQAPEGSAERMQYGPVIAQSFEFPDSPLKTVGRGLAIRLAHEALVVFDKDTMRYAVGTADGSVDLSGTDSMQTKGQNVARVGGRDVFSASQSPGWAHEGSFEDPRPNQHSPLPKEWARYRGYFRDNDQIVLSYNVGTASVLEMPTAVEAEGQVAIVRHIRIEGADDSMTALLCDLRDGENGVRQGDRILVPAGEEKTMIALLNAPDNARLELGSEGRVTVRLNPQDKPLQFQVVYTTAPDDESGVIESVRNKIDPHFDLKAMTQGSSTQWPQTLTLQGKRAGKDAAYVVDTLPVPESNPWHSFMRITGFDFFPDGRAAVCTMNGDVWLVRGLDASLDEVQWKRFASGLYQPLGLAIRNGEIFVLEQGQITRLNDVNGDQEADFYENFNGGGPFKPRAYWMCLAADSQGRFYYVRDGNRAQNMPEHGCLVQVSQDGESAEIYATGLRQANGLAIGPDDVMLAADQQGNWVPATRIDRIHQGRFYGYRPTADPDIPIGSFSQPICWLPQTIDNSAGGQVYVDDDRWGPLADHWVHTSWGRARVYLMLMETVQGTPQGGAVAMPINRFRSGVMRAKVNPADGQVYVAGIGVFGWTGVGTQPTTFNRIRYTGKLCYMPIELHARKGGVEIEFAAAVDAETAGSPENYNVERWDYKYTSEYGSPHYSVNNPDTEGQDTVNVAKVSVGSDKRSVFLHIPDMQPVQQMMIQYDIEAADGSPMKNAIYHTVHRLGE